MVLTIIGLKYTGLKHIREFVQARTNTNILVGTAPHGSDLTESPCINKETQVYNTKLEKMMTLSKHSVIVETTVTSMDYTMKKAMYSIQNKKFYTK
jgi:hypothetical protein